ncbi:MAG: DUF2799 domain-containing protein [Pseudomonadota bacterium]
MRWTIWLGCVVGLSGCAGLQELSCAGTDSLALGERLGRQGAPEAALAAEAASCAGTGAPLRMDLLEQGFAAGRRAYCTPAVAFENGRDGRGLTALCPAATMAALTDANGRGRLAREIDVELADAYRRLERLEARLRSQRNAEESGEDGDPNDSARHATRRDIRALTRRIERLEDRRFLLRAGI